MNPSTVGETEPLIKNNDFTKVMKNNDFTKVMKNNDFTKVGSVSDAGSYLRLIDF